MRLLLDAHLSGARVRDPLRNARDFAPILREWAELGRTRHGCVLVWTLDHHAFAAIVDGVSRLLASHPEAGDWADRVLAI